MLRLSLWTDKKIHVMNFHDRPRPTCGTHWRPYFWKEHSFQFEFSKFLWWILPQNSPVTDATRRWHSLDGGENSLRPLDSSAFNMFFLHFVTLWPWPLTFQPTINQNYLEWPKWHVIARSTKSAIITTTLPLLGYPKIIPYCKFEDFTLESFVFIARQLCWST